MIFKDALNETTLFTHGGAPKTRHDSKRSKFASKKVKKTGKNVHLKDYEKAVKDGSAYLTWIWPIKGKI